MDDTLKEEGGEASEGYGGEPLLAGLKDGKAGESQRKSSLVGESIGKNKKMFLRDNYS